MSKLDFDAFFDAVHGRAALPWQSRLARMLQQTHRWPDVVDLPTASGKTACIDIALFHLACCAEAGTPWLAARRIVFAVDRRIIVDSAYERALLLCKALGDPAHPAVAAVRDALASLGGAMPLDCLKLRGGMPRERGFAYDPCQPMIVSSTIDQIGSRLLFRGYGLSRYAQPLHAGLLGHDTLILLDEAHLSDPFVDTVTAIRREQARAEVSLAPVRPVFVVPLSATARAGGERFQLDADDLAHPVIAQRRTAPKPARLVDVGAKPNDRVKAIVAAVAHLHKQLDREASTLAVIVNRVRTARDVYEQLAAAHGSDAVTLAIGRNRPLARDALSVPLLARCAAGREPRADDRPYIVVATQTLEVGADLDFNGLVTECAALDALRQRFGRLDRLGSFRDAAAIVIGGGEPDNDPVYGAAIARTWEWLQRVATDGGVDFSIDTMERLLADEHVAALQSPRREGLTLTPAHVELLCQTDPAPQHDPDVAALLHGFESAPPDIHVVWRSDLPLQDAGADVDDSEPELVKQLLALRPPTSLETLALPIGNVKAWLTDAASDGSLADVEGASDPSDGDAPKRGKPERARRVWRQQRDGDWHTVDAARLRPGDAIVVPTVYGGCDRYGYAPTDAAAVDDLADAARASLHSEAVVIVTRRFLAGLGTFDAVAVTDLWRRFGEAVEDGSADEACQRLRDAFAPHEPPAWLAYRIAETLLRRDGSLYALVLRSGKLGTEDISDEDLSSSRTKPVLLATHSAGVGRRAQELASGAGLEPSLCATLGAAGYVHDFGKADPRFQRLLRRGDETATAVGQLLAKGLRSKSSSYEEPSERHEAYSVALASAHPDLLRGAADPDLALYLIGSHHGRGRALMPDRPDDGAIFDVSDGTTRYSFDGVPRLGALGSGWPDRFWRLVRRYGPWGLAYLEALLRLADHLQSRAELDGTADD